MDKFERKFGKYAIRNLSLVLIICYGIGYLIQMLPLNIAGYLTLNPYMILRGQIWRLVTWILIPPQGGIFVIFMLLFYYSIGTALERTWGTFRYNVYLFSGMIFTVIGSFVAMGLVYLFYGDVIAALGAEQVFAIGANYFSTYYVNMSIFLAFAATFPDAQVLLMFIIPIRVKWLGIVYGVMLLIDFMQGAVGNYKELSFVNVFYRVALLVSLLNFILFFFFSRKHVFVSPKQMKRKQQFKSEVRKNSSVTKHKCAVCGRTDESNPELEFRFCSKCDGNYEYCQDHLFTHKHVKKDDNNK